MDEFDFTDGLKIVLVSVFMLGSVQLHALIDESSQHGPDRAKPAAVMATQGTVGTGDSSTRTGTDVRATAFSDRGRDDVRDSLAL